jgi:hypothetical protein
MTSRVQQVAVAPLGYVTLPDTFSTGTVAKGARLFSDICSTFFSPTHVAFEPIFQTHSSLHFCCRPLTLMVMARCRVGASRCG